MFKIFSHAIVVAAAIILFWSCDEDSKSPVAIEISYDTIASNLATISWSHHATTYEIYFEGDLVYEGTDQHFTFTELIPATSYSGTLIGHHINGTKSKHDISFKTEASLPPTSFEITEIRHNSPTEVVVFYEEAMDPENGLVTYEIHIQNTRLGYEHTLIEPGDGFFRIFRLYHSCDHEGQIIAIDEAGKKTEVKLTFRTLTPSPVFKGDLYLNSQFEVDIFPYTSIEGRLGIWGENVHDISNLLQLESVWNEISIDHTTLRSTHGLENVEIIETSDHRPLSGRTLTISDNKNLQSIAPMPKVEVLATLIIANNDSLRNLDNFSSLTQLHGEATVGVYRVDSELSIHNNKMLENIDGLSNVKTLGNPRIGFSGNNSLINLNGLANARIIGTQFPLLPTIYIGFHPHLTNLCGVTQIVKDIYGTGWFSDYAYKVEANVFNPSVQDLVNGHCVK